MLKEMYPTRSFKTDVMAEIWCFNVFQKNPTHLRMNFPPVIFIPHKWNDSWSLLHPFYGVLHSLAVNKLRQLALQHIGPCLTAYTNLYKYNYFCILFSITVFSYISFQWQLEPFCIFTQKSSWKQQPQNVHNHLSGLFIEKAKKEKRVETSQNRHLPSMLAGAFIAVHGHPHLTAEWSQTHRGHSFLGILPCFSNCWSEGVKWQVADMLNHATNFIGLVIITTIRKKSMWRSCF